MGVIIVQHALACDRAVATRAEKSSLFPRTLSAAGGDAIMLYSSKGTPTITKAYHVPDPLFE